jgi:hypothetical protein
MNNRQHRIQLLSRINRGKAETLPFLTSLSEVLGESVEATALIGPGDSDLIMRTFHSSYQSAIQAGAASYHRYFRADERRLVLQLADCIAGQLNSENGFFLTKLGKDNRAVKLNISVLLKHTASVIRLDGDSLSVLSEDHAQGLLIDHNLDDSEQAYEIAAWGEGWSIVTHACDQC